MVGGSLCSIELAEVILLFFSVLKTLIHDPLVEWEKVKGCSSSDSARDKVMKFFRVCIVCVHRHF